MSVWVFQVLQTIAGHRSRHMEYPAPVPWLSFLHIGANRTQGIFFKNCWTESQCCPVWSGTYYTAQSGLELTTVLPPPPQECWASKHQSPSQANLLFCCLFCCVLFLVLGVEYWASHEQGEHSATELDPWVNSCLFLKAKGRGGFQGPSDCCQIPAVRT